MPDLRLLLPDGTAIPAVAGDTVLGAFQRAGARLQTVCKGRGICGACRIQFDDASLARLKPRSVNENRLLTYLDPSGTNHRLACQIILDESLNGLRLAPAPVIPRTPVKETIS